MNAKRHTYGAEVLWQRQAQRGLSGPLGSCHDNQPFTTVDATGDPFEGSGPRLSPTFEPRAWSVGERQFQKVEVLDV